ncbi:hypothetical protein BKA65DRAFT_542442 [Rhexocercosporidium sp. MPI-PUGE-AT-0058]|nr:hypothetical protein BKA65DRAFT_542442 [Rhexocercosporidium sp. MPI-PUGE-AT-0058]
MMGDRNAEPQVVHEACYQPHQASQKTCRGIIVDQVSYIGERIPLPPPSQPHESQPEIKSKPLLKSPFPIDWLIYSTVDFEAPVPDIDPERPILQYPIGGKSQVDAFWRMLIKDKDADGKIPGPEFNGSHFSPWFREVLRMGYERQEEEKRRNLGTSEVVEEEGANNGPIPEGMEVTKDTEEEWARGDDPLEVDENIQVFDGWVRAVCAGKMMVRGKKGFLGILDEEVDVGDVVYVLKECEDPVVLRRIGGDEEGKEKWALVGEAYVYGIMDGEVWGLGLKEKEFVII